MAIPAVIDGSDITVFIGEAGSEELVAYGTSHTLTRTYSTFSASNKDTVEIEQSRPHRMDVTVRCDHLISYGKYEDLFAAILDGTSVKLILGKKVVDPSTGTSLDTSTKYASGTFLLSSLEETATDGEMATYSVTFELADNFAWANS